MATDVSLAASNPNYLSGSIKWSGLGSGTDFNSIVDQLIKIEQVSVTRLETWKSTWEKKNVSIQGLNSRLASLESFVKGFDSYTEFYSRSSSSSDDSVLRVINSGSASTGSHTIVVGQNIPGQVISRSYEDEMAVGGSVGGSLIIHVGDKTLTLTGVDGAPAAGEFDINADIDALAQAVKNADNAQPTPILGEVYTVLDKDRGGAVFKRLIITGLDGGSANQVWVEDPTALDMDSKTIDAVYEKTWLGSSTAASTGNYYGNTNKTFTFGVKNTGTLGTDDVVILWADNEGNSGQIDINAADWTPAKEYEVLQGVKLTFTAGAVFKDDSFTVDCFAPTLQAAQDKGLAQVEQRVHEGFIDLLTPLTSTSATFVYRYAGIESSVSIPANGKLQDLVNAINSDPNNPGVTAGIINDGQRTSTSYHLVLTGKETGAEHSIEIVSSTMTDFDASEAKFSTPQKAADSLIKVDGFPSQSAQYIHRPTNTVADVIDGVVLELYDSGEAVVTVANDREAVEENIELLVSSVNFVLDYIRQETKYDPETKETGVMIGNYTYDIVRNLINETLIGAVPGLERGSDVYTSLSQIGIKTDPNLNGQWTIDTSVLKTALSNNPEAVARLFVRDDEKNSQGVCDRLQSKMEELTDAETGIANVLLSNYSHIISDIDDKIAREEKRIALVRQRLEEKFARLETLLAQLGGQSSYIESQIAKLPTIGQK
ncbi:MAG: flagellar filament capping protein FliD [Pseudomonadota bacterium]